MKTLIPLERRLSPERFETPAILKKLNTASRQLAELKGIVASIPNQAILIDTLGLQEAKDSSEIENIITTHNDLFQQAVFPQFSGNPAAKEVACYREALWAGFQRVSDSKLLTSKHILTIQAELEKNHAGFRKLPGTELRNNAGATIYIPPTPEVVPQLMTDLERFINDDQLFVADPLVKMALIHHQFESIHPFYDGNGRCGRIINVLYLVQQDLLNIPVLYLSRFIVQHKGEYYRLLQDVRDADSWENWVMYMMDAVEQTALETVASIQAIKNLLFRVKHAIRKKYRFYSQDLINNLFRHPYTRIEFIMQDMGVSRLTATNYLNQLTAGGFLQKRKLGRNNYYINMPLCRILADNDEWPAYNE
ncbi:Fic family protein [Desulfobulbus sp.]|uniref:Fic family protein n=1 Tax=Desulfobulbus sp. TaxID=895 RepID=UPI00286F41F9|nr:Fic family protein [Desulfobulbus sp.]